MSEGLKVARLTRIPCKQCGGEMLQKKVRKLGGCLGVLGTIFTIIGLVCALIGGVMTFAGTKATVETVQKVDDDAYQTVLRELEAIEGGPWDFTREFRENRRIDPKTLESMPEPPRARVRSILGDHALLVGAGQAGAVIGGGIAVGLGGGLLIGGLLGLVLGLVLGLKSKVWRCRSCGVVLERA